MINEIFPALNFPIDDPEIGAMVIFKDVTPIYLKVNFLKWCEIGLAEIGSTRKQEKRAIAHVQTEFIGLINAVHCVAITTMDEDQLEEHFQQYYGNYYQKDAEKVLNPSEFCTAFFEGITLNSLNSILWILMDAVTENREKYGYQREQTEILTLFKRFSAVITMGYDWGVEIKD